LLTIAHFRLQLRIAREFRNSITADRLDNKPIGEPGIDTCELSISILDNLPGARIFALVIA